MTHFSHLDSFLTPRTTFYIMSYFLHCNPFFKLWPVLYIVTQFLNCDTFLILWPICHTVGHFLHSPFQAVTHFLHCDPFFTLCISDCDPLFTVLSPFFTHDNVIRFSHCDTFLQCDPFFHTENFFTLRFISYTVTHFTKRHIRVTMQETSHSVKTGLSLNSLSYCEN